MLKIKCYSTGSWGNMYLIDFNDNKFIIEIGFNWALKRNDLKNIQGVFITHNHGDHVGYLNSFVKNYPSVKIYLTPGTYNEWLKKADFLSTKLINPQLTTYDNWYQVNERLRVYIGESFHDTPQPCYFIFNDLITGENLIFITDTGKLPILPKIENHNKTYVLLEANYDPKLMSDSIKDLRSSSDVGHLSINAAKKFINDYPDFNFVGLIHGSTSKLNQQSDLIFKNYKHVERIYSGWEKTLGVKNGL